MTFRPEVRVINRDGTLGHPIPVKVNLNYLDDGSDVGVVSFEHPRGGKHTGLLDYGVECAIFVNGHELRNSRFILDELASKEITESRATRTWAGWTLLGRLDEALVLPEEDRHMREDVVTDAERRLLAQQREEWMEQQVARAKKEAKQKARDWNEANNPIPKSGGGGSTPGGGEVPKGAHAALRKRAIRWATGQIGNPSQDWYRMCQSFVRQSYGFPGIYSTAAEAWFAGRKRPNTSQSDVPPGVPVYWAPNHVALSIGGGRAIGTDFCQSGQVCEHGIAELTAGWGLSYRGWSPDVSGRTVYP